MRPAEHFCDIVLNQLDLHSLPAGGRSVWLANRPVGAAVTRKYALAAPAVQVWKRQPAGDVLALPPRP